MKQAIMIGLLAMLGCGQTQEFIEAMNEAPQINFTANTLQPVLRDSVKLGTEGSPVNYRIELKVTDRNNNIREVRYEQLDGNGKLFQHDQEVFSNNIEFQSDSSLLNFEYHPLSKGNHSFSIRVTDSFGLNGRALIELVAFENLLPVAKFTARKIGQRSRYEWKIDASESFDRDRQYGGGIEEYEFSVLGKIYTILSDNMYVIFPETGIYTIGVRVKDNDNKWSEKAEISGLVVD